MVSENRQSSYEAQTAQQTYLYHKEDARRSRRPPPSRLAAARRGPARDFSHTVLWRNLRIALIVLVCMGMFLLVAMFVIKKGWQWSGEATVRQRERIIKGVPSGVAPAGGVAAVAATNAAMAPEESLREDAVTQLNAVAIREAVFLEKQGKALAISGHYQEAVNSYQKAIDEWPHLSDVWANLGQAYLALGQYDKAGAALEKALVQDPGNALILNDLGVSFLQQGMSDKAAPYFQEAAEADPAFADPHFNLALCAKADKQTEAVTVHLARFLERKPGDARGLKELAFQHAKSGAYDESLACLETALSSTPAWSELYFDAAAAAALKGDGDLAVRYLTRALSVTPAEQVRRVYEQAVFKETRQTANGIQLETLLAGDKQVVRPPEEQANTAGGQILPIASPMQHE